MIDRETVWSSILGTLRENISEQGFNTWFHDTEVIHFDDDSLNVKVPTQFISEYLNQNYSQLISEICYNLFAKKCQVKFTNMHVPQHTEKFIKIASKPQSNFTSKLNEKYSFEEFVIGKNNRFAHSASLSVAENPGLSYNPLFLYGESGMGKTHLMQAIGNYVTNETQNKSVFYTTTEEFTNEMINGIRNNKMQDFREKYRNIDVLLIDDIHFLSKKEGTQEEFFHTFNALYEKKKQIVLTKQPTTK